MQFQRVLTGGGGGGGGGIIQGGIFGVSTIGAGGGDEPGGKVGIVIKPYFIISLIDIGFGPFLLL